MSILSARVIWVVALIVNVPFILQGSLINTFAAGVISGIIICSFMDA